MVGGGGGGGRGGVVSCTGDVGDSALVSAEGAVTSSQGDGSNFKDTSSSVVCIRI